MLSQVVDRADTVATQSPTLPVFLTHLPRGDAFGEPALVVVALRVLGRSSRRASLRPQPWRKPRYRSQLESAQVRRRALLHAESVVGPQSKPVAPVMGYGESLPRSKNAIDAEAARPVEFGVCDQDTDDPDRSRSPRPPFDARIRRRRRARPHPSPRSARSDSSRRLADDRARRRAGWTGAGPRARRRRHLPRAELADDQVVRSADGEDEAQARGVGAAAPGGRPRVAQEQGR